MLLRSIGLLERCPKTFPCYQHAATRQQILQVELVSPYARPSRASFGQPRGATNRVAYNCAVSSEQTERRWIAQPPQKQLLQCETIQFQMIKTRKRACRDRLFLIREFGDQSRYCQLLV